MKEYFELLGIDMNATYEDVKKAYRDLSKRYHPDLNPNIYSDEKMKEINVAYEEVLKYIKNNNENESYVYEDEDLNDMQYKKTHNYGENYNNINNKKNVKNKYNIDLNDINPNLIYFGNVYVVKYKPGVVFRPFGTPYKDVIEYKLVRKNAVLIQVGIGKYIDISKIPDFLNLDKVNERLDKYFKKRGITVFSDFFAPYVGDFVVTDIDKYVSGSAETINLKQLKKIRKKSVS